MKTFFAVLLYVSFASSVAMAQNAPPVGGSAPAVTAPANNPPVGGAVPPAPAPAKTLTVNQGKLTKIDGKSLTLTQKVNPAVIVLTVDDNTKYLKLLNTVMPNGSDFQQTVKSSLDDLAPGQHVWAQYVADTKVVLEIEILPELRPGHGRLAGE